MTSTLPNDAERYRLLRRGQHWSVINGVGDTLRAEALDAEIDAVLKQGALFSTPPCLDCGAETQKDAEDRCICNGDKDSCHGCHLWPSGSE